MPDLLGRGQRNTMEFLSIVAAIMLMASPTYQYLETLEDLLVYPIETSNIQKREAKKTNDAFDDFVEEKLIQHTQALEQLVRMVQAHSDVVKQLVENMGKHVDKPRLPEHMEFTRRSLDGKLVSVPSSKPQSKSPWCPLAISCKRTVNPLCGFDDNFGYGKFDDMCHMFQVNCYWKFNFSPVASCKPKF